MCELHYFYDSLCVMHICDCLQLLRGWLLLVSGYGQFIMSDMCNRVHNMPIILQLYILQCWLLLHLSIRQL